MSNELVMAAIPSECLPWEALRERQADGSVKTLGEIYWPKGRQNAPRFVTPEQAMAEHPDAHWQVEIRPSQLWRPPPPPDGRDVRRDRKARREYRQVLRASLEAFLNRHLADLNFMFSTGAFVLGVARARIVEFRPVPKRVMREFGKAIKKVTKRKPLRKPIPEKKETR